MTSTDIFPPGYPTVAPDDPDPEWLGAPTEVAPFNSVREGIEQPSAPTPVESAPVVTPPRELTFRERVEAEARRRLAAGEDVRDVLGAVDMLSMALASPERSDAYIAEVFAQHAAAHYSVAEFNQRHASRCYHGRPNVPGACPWCIEAAKRSDSLGPSDVMGVWDAPDCEGE